MTDAATLNATLAGRYAVEREIGAGGMAVVYLANDLRHRRKVALKVLRPELAAVIGAERFLREIETTANLQHPHILPLHDSGTVEGTAFYVMPYVEGESLRDRLRRETQLPIDDAVRIAREVASALDYAHRHGVVHRDIKPENILLHDGQALVADFGIALAVSSAGGGSRMTETGMSLGTPNYMSPEQAMGDREITPRSDVYALGCVLYEMLLGEPPFTGPSAQAVIARVVTEEPRSLTQQRKSIPLHVNAAVHMALEKLPADRFASAAEFSTALATPSFTGAYASPQAVPPRRSTREWLLDRRTLGTVGALAVLLGAALLAMWWRRPDADGPVLRTVIAPPDSMRSFISSPFAGRAASSPDGRIVAFSLAREDSTVLLVKLPDRFEPWAVPGGGRWPVFSPDGRWLAYHRDAAIWKVRVDGGDPVRVGALANVPLWTLAGLAWHRDGNLYCATHAGLWRLPSAGGEATMLRPVDSTGMFLMGPSAAPDGRLLVTVPRGRAWRLALLAPDGNVLTELPDDIGGPGWFVGDILVFWRGQFSAGRFDLDKLAITGEPVGVSDVPAYSSYGLTAVYAGTSGGGRAEIVWVSRSGVVAPTGLPVASYRWPRLSPDGSRLATALNDSRISVFHLATRGRVGLPPTNAGEPVWTQDGRRVLTSFGSVASLIGLAMRAADGNQRIDTIIAPSREETWPTDISRGDSLVVFYGTRGDDPSDILVLNLRSKETRRVEIPGAQRGGRLSPDMRWLAYQSTENGRSEVFVQPWPALDARHMVSPDGGDEPSWSRDGRELFFRQDDRMMAVRVAPGPGFQPGDPVELFRGAYMRDIATDQSYDVAPDGRFLMLRPASEARQEIQVIYNWGTELRRRLDEANRKQESTR